MNILFICDEYPPSINGGVGSITQILSCELVNRGHNVCVVGLYTFEDKAADYEIDNGVKIWRFRYGFNLFSINILYKIQRKLPNFLKSILYGKRDFNRFVFELGKIIKDQNIDIIEQPDWCTFAYDIGINNPILPQLGIPLTIKSHGSHSYFSQELSTPIIRKSAAIDKKLYARGNAISSVSKYCAEQNQIIFDINVVTRILYNAIPQQTIKANRQRLNNLVFFSGTLVHKKGIFSLVKAWNIVNSIVPEAKLVIFGKGDSQVLKNLLNQTALQTVDFKGHQSRESLMEYLQIATLSIFPSYSETFGLGAVESMSCGCPTIFTKRSCGPEIIQDKENGLLVDPDNIDEIVSAILLLLGDGTLRERIGQKGKRDVEQRFSIPKLAREHIEWYQSIISDFQKTTVNF